MLLAFFRSNQPAVLLAVPLLAALLFMPAFWGAPPAHTGAMPLYALLLQLTGGYAGLRTGLALVLIVLLAVQLAALLNALELLDRRNHLVALLFPMLFAGLSPSMALDPALLGMPLVLFALRRTWALPNAGPGLSRVFDAGLLIGLAGLCYLPYLFMLFVVWASVSVIRPFAWREYLLPLLAVALVLYLAWGLLRVLGLGPWEPMATLRAQEATPAVVWTSPMRKDFVALAVLWLLLGFAAFNKSYARSVMRGKNQRSGLMAFAMALGILMVLLSLIKGAFPSVIAAVPASVIMAYLALAPRRPWLAELATLAGLGLAFWLQWAPS